MKQPPDAGKRPDTKIFPLVSGENVALSTPDFRPGILILDFWASWIVRKHIFVAFSQVHSNLLQQPQETNDLVCSWPWHLVPSGHHHCCGVLLGEFLGISYLFILLAWCYTSLYLPITNTNSTLDVGFIFSSYSTLKHGLDPRWLPRIVSYWGKVRNQLGDWF